jgi:hypothetical protein
MQVFITLDRFDGSQSKIKCCDLEDFNVRSLVFQMMSSDVCGVTITKVVKNTKLIQKMKSKE